MTCRSTINFFPKYHIQSTLIFVNNNKHSTEKNYSNIKILNILEKNNLDLFIQPYFYDNKFNEENSKYNI